MMKFFLFFFLSLPLLASPLEVKPLITAYEFELLAQEIALQKMSSKTIEKLKFVDQVSSRLNKKGKFFFLKNSIYKGVLKNQVFSKTRKSLTKKEYSRLIDKFNEQRAGYSTFTNWILEAVLVETKPLSLATTNEEFLLISRKPKVKQALELSSNMVLDFLNLSPQKFSQKVHRLSLNVLQDLYQDALILKQTVHLNKEKEQTALLIKKQKEKKEVKKAKVKPSKEYLPEVDPSSAIDTIKVDENQWKPKN